MKTTIRSYFTEFYMPIEEAQTNLKSIVDNLKVKPKYSFIDNDTYIGIEVEVEQVLRTAGFISLGDRYLWKNTEDGSLRNNGREFVSIPIKGKQISYALESLFKQFKKDRGCLGYEFTDRTSIHIHVNYRDETLETLGNSLLLYLLVEPLLYGFVGGDRAKNIFCVPIKDEDNIERLSGLFCSIEGKKKHFQEYVNRWSKYSGLNLLPLVRYGTIEYRHLVGTDDQDKINTWINILFRIKQYAKNTNYDKLKSIILNLNTSSDYIAILQDLFGDVFAYGDYGNLEYLLEESSMFIKEIFAYSQDDWKVFFKDGAGDKESLFYSKYIKLGIFKVKDNKDKTEIIFTDEYMTLFNANIGAALTSYETSIHSGRIPTRVSQGLVVDF